MRAKYKLGQKVRIRSAGGSVLRDSALDPYAGKVGEVISHHWISPQPGSVFYIYTVRIGPGSGKVVLHEDEIEGC